MLSSTCSRATLLVANVKTNSNFTGGSKMPLLVKNARLVQASVSTCKLQQRHSMTSTGTFLKEKSTIISRRACFAVTRMGDYEEGEEEMMIEESAREKMEKSLEVFIDNLETVRTGRASTKVLDRIEVEYYGAPCSIQSLASVTSPDAQSLVVQPFDKTSIQVIEKAIMMSDLGFTPSNDGNIIRLIVPTLTQERRKELTKVVSRLGEDAKVALRNIRRDAAKQLQKLEKNGSSSKDMIADYCQTIDEMTAKFVSQVDDAVSKKEADLMKV